MLIHRSALILPLCLFLWSCAQPTKEWVSTPQERILEKPPFSITIRPEMRDSPGLNVFFLSLENRGSEPIAIDWNRSHYRLNGKRAGQFVFAGIDPATVKAATVPPEVIPPGSTLQKIFGPLKTIAFAPLKERKQAADRGLSYGLLPEGENSVLLLLTMGDQRIRGRFTFQIDTQTVE